MVRLSRVAQLVALVPLVSCAVPDTDGARGASIEPDARPDVLLILVDDLGRHDLGGEGHAWHSTPHLDRLRESSVRFDEAYTNAPNCAPSRAALMSGRFGIRTGIHTVASPAQGPEELRAVVPPVNRRDLDDAERTLAESLRDAGYRTGFVGKWHLGEDPTTQGFDRNVAGSRAGHPRRYSPPYENDTLADGPADEYLIDRLGAETRALIEDFEAQPDGRPWFVMYAPYAVHTPLQAPAERIEALRARHPELSLRAVKYAVMVESADAAIGRVLEAVDPERTVVAFASDNGGLQPITDNAPLRGGKGMLYEGGIATPLYLRVPHVAPRTVRTPVQVFDLHPTLLELCGVEPTPALDAVSLLPALDRPEFDRGPIFWHFPAYLRGNDDESREPDLPFRTTPAGVIRDGRWKLIEWFDDGGLELYDLDADPGELTDLSESAIEIRDTLAAELMRWQVGTGAQIPTPR